MPSAVEKPLVEESGRKFENKELALVTEKEGREIAEQQYVDKQGDVREARKKLAELTLARSLSGNASLDTIISDVAAQLVCAEELARLNYQAQK